nr:S8 family peptidase [uncultured Clostridium sp.]
MEKILDNNYYDLIINNVSVPLYDTGDNITPLSIRHSLLNVPVGNADPCNLGKYPYYSFPSLYTTTSTISIEKSGIGAVQRNPFLNLSGRGIIIGVIDTGIDYQHQTFLFKDGTTRIFSIWDQSIQDGTPPDTFTFGTEYSREMINLALVSENPSSIVPSKDTDGHGTAIASIIAGMPEEEQTFTGIVPQAELVIVKLKDGKANLKNIYFVPEDIPCYQESDLILGVRYLEYIAQKVNRPLAVCIALGSSQGAHDGSGAFSNYLNYLVRLPGYGIAVSAGNQGNSRRHYFNSTGQEPFFNNFELRIGEKDKMFSMEIWPTALGRLSIDISTTNRESTKLIRPGLGECRKFKFVFTPSVLWVNNMSFEEESGDQLILLRFQNAMPGIWSFHVQSMENEPLSFHSWLPAGSLISDETFFLNSNPNSTITSPGNGTHQLTVTAYNQFNDSILIESSRGYSRNNLVKPDISAPGYQIPCALPGNHYGTLTGTGAAAAHAAGVIAMILEWGIPRGNYTTLSGSTINSLITRGARRDPSTAYPNNIWGYGMLDINELFQRLTNI